MKGRLAKLSLQCFAFTAAITLALLSADVERVCPELEEQD
jgi:hypothetical protein